jgi:hypothetical protein
MVTCLFVTEANCVELPFSENPHSAEEEPYPRIKADEVQWAVLDSEDTMFTAFCKAMWQTPNRRELTDVLTSYFIVFKSMSSLSLYIS